MRDFGQPSTQRRIQRPLSRLKAAMSIAGLLWGGAGSALAAPAKTEADKKEVFTAGEAITRCSAYYLYAAEVANDLRRPASQEQFENQARGWLLAGQFLMSAGAAKADFDAAFTAEQVRAARLTTIRAAVEAKGAAAFAALSEEHQATCEPYGDVVDGVISKLRRSTTR